MKNRRIRNLGVCLGALFLVIVMSISACTPPATPPSGEGEWGPPIKVGIMGAMKIAPGQDFWKGASLAAEEINAAGGVVVAGVPREFEVVKYDTNEFASIPDAVNTMEYAITRGKVEFLIGANRSEAVLAMMEIMAEYKVPWLNAPSAPQTVGKVADDYDKYKYFFRVGTVGVDPLSRGALSTTWMAWDKLSKEIGVDKPNVALLCEKTLGATYVIDLYQAAHEKAGWPIVGRWEVGALATDVTAEMSAIKASGAHIINYMLSGPSGIPYGKAYGELEVPALSIGCNQEAMKTTYWEATGGYCNYDTTIEMIGPCGLSDKTLPFWNNYMAQGSDWGYPGFSSAVGYDSMYIYKDAIERAGTTEADAVVEALEETNWTGVMGQLTFTSNHDTPYGPDACKNISAQWQNGELVPVWPRDWKGYPWEDVWWDKPVTLDGTVEFMIPPRTLEHFSK